MVASGRRLDPDTCRSHLPDKLDRLIVFGAGYVLGTRAGRARFESITEAAQRLERLARTFVRQARLG